MNWVRICLFRKGVFKNHVLPLRAFGETPVHTKLLFFSKFHTNSTLRNVDASIQEEEPCVLQTVSKSSSTALKVKKISKAMKAYLERAKNHNVFLETKNEEFEIGKHHLANMMGIDVGTMTQDDIDKAIEYLLPSGLYEPKARPLMKPPEQLFPKEKAAQFDDSGRPFSAFFFTKHANFYTAIFEMVEKFNELDAFEDKMLRKGIASPPDEYKLDLSGGEWLSKDELTGMFLENVNDYDYDFIITTLTRLAQHPYAFRIKDDIWKYRKDFMDMSAMEEIPELKYDSDGRPYAEAEGRKKSAKARVILWGNGTGKVDICGEDISYFHRLEDRQQILLPLELTDMLNKVDFKATVELGGMSSQAGCIRYCISLCLRSFVSEECRERMRLAGLLTRDTRKRERKKPGQKGARAKHRWVKR